MKIWNQAHIQVKLTNTLKYLENNQSVNSAELFESIKSDLSKEEDFDYVIGKGEESFGKKKVMQGNVTVKDNSFSDIEFEISFNYICVNRKDNTRNGDYQNSCIFRFKANKDSKLITDYIS